MKTCRRSVGGVIGACVVMLPTLPFARCVAAAQPLAPLLECRALADAAARLDCFDRESAALAQPATANPAPAAVPTPGAAPRPRAPPGPAAAPEVAAAPALDATQRFGLPERNVIAAEVAAGRRVADALKIEARLVSVSSGANGHAVFVLDNDQVWRQLANGDDLLAIPGDSVTISRAALGSYWLKTPSGRGCKVSRVR